MIRLKKKSAELCNLSHWAKIINISPIVDLEVKYLPRQGFLFPPTPLLRSTPLHLLVFFTRKNVPPSSSSLRGPRLRSPTIIHASTVISFSLVTWLPPTLRKNYSTKKRIQWVRRSYAWLEALKWRIRRTFIHDPPSLECSAFAM